MAVPRIMVGGEVITSTSGARSSNWLASQAAWSLLGLAGFALFVVGGTDFLLTFVPPRFGNPEWGFGSVTAGLNAIPAALIGLTMMLGAAIVRESAGSVRLFAVILVLWALYLIAVGVLYGLTLPLAAKGFGIPDLGTGLKRAVFRTLVQLLTYTAVMLWMAVRGWRVSRTIAS